MVISHGNIVVIRYRAHDGRLRKDKSIAVDPIGVCRVELHELVEEDVGNRCHAPKTLLVYLVHLRYNSCSNLHRGTRMARVSMSGSISLAIASMLVEILFFFGYAMSIHLLSSTGDGHCGKFYGIAMAGQPAGNRIERGRGLTARMRMVLMASQSVSVYPMIATILGRASCYI